MIAHYAKTHNIYEYENKRNKIFKTLMFNRFSIGDVVYVAQPKTTKKKGKTLYLLYLPN